jgi:hypothetical protein
MSFSHANIREWQNGQFICGNNRYRWELSNFPFEITTDLLRKCGGRDSVAGGHNHRRRARRFAVRTGWGGGVRELIIFTHLQPPRGVRQ